MTETIVLVLGVGGLLTLVVMGMAAMRTFVVYRRLETSRAIAECVERVVRNYTRGEPLCAELVQTTVV